MDQLITFKIDEQVYKIDSNTNLLPSCTLNYFLRNVANLKGTKFMCLEGGCGACVVSVQIPGLNRELAINSCLVSIFSCNQWIITTINGLKNTKIADNLQENLQKFGGSQCGFCTSGMIMNMYSLLKDRTDSVNMNELIEDSFGGNICRCTGYRPILDAFRNVAHSKDIDIDIEDLICKQEKSVPNKICLKFCNRSEWFSVTSIAEIFELFLKYTNYEYMLVAGNTARAIYKDYFNKGSLFIDIEQVIELKNYTFNDNGYLYFGANNTLSQTLEFFQGIYQQKEDFSYLMQLYEHIKLIANVPVRNIGTIAGNLMIKYYFNEFPSDIFLLLETVKAQLLIVSKNGQKEQLYNLSEFLKIEMKYSLIKSVIFAPISNKNCFIKTYKIMPRFENAHAYVNSGFYLITENDNDPVIKEIRLIYGGINSKMIHATKTEEFLINKQLFQNENLQNAFKKLFAEIAPSSSPTESSIEFRKTLAVSLFYKFILSICPENKMNKLNKTGGNDLQRPLSKATQKFDTVKKLFPLTEPVSKIESKSQCSGKAEYIIDISLRPNELFAVFLLADCEPLSTFEINISKAKEVDGFIDFIDCNDISGINSYTPAAIGFQQNEPIFANKKILYNGQPIGLIVGNNQLACEQAVKRIEVSYSKTSKNPSYTDMKRVIENNIKKRIKLERQMKSDKQGADVFKIINGEFYIAGQYHYAMETQACICVPLENDELDVYAGTQWMDLTQIAIANALNMPQNKVNVYVRRLGGAYGSKISRATMIATACAVAAKKLDKPVRLLMSLKENMQAIGKRFPCYAKYEAGVNEQGVIQYLKLDFYEDYGCFSNERNVQGVFDFLINCYDYETWSINGYGVTTDNTPNTFCRAPGSTEGIAMIETVMNHIANELNLDCIQVRLANINKEKNMPLLKMINNIQENNNYLQRKNEIEDFNKNNNWRKKGISVSFMNYTLSPFGNFSVIVSIYATDGTISISHGGIEVGQGINTKVAQVCAYCFGIDLNMISVKPSNTLTAPNGGVTGGSVTSEACCLATVKACEIIKKRLSLNKKKYKVENVDDWINLIQNAHKKGIDLCATAMFSKSDYVDNKNYSEYSIYGVCIGEVEVDLLTGRSQITRVDLLEDVGQSISPLVDIGQIEGAFVMGIGYWLIEKLVYDQNTGFLYTHNTWFYKTPGIKDIPIEFNVSFVRNNRFNKGILGSKATGEPPLCLSIVIPLSIRNALETARENKASKWFPIDGPTSVEEIFMKSLHNIENFLL